MHIADAPVFGAHCHVVFDKNEKSTVTVSLTPDQHNSASLVQFGTLAYALPTGKQTVSSTLISQGDQAQVDTATETSRMLAAVLQRPVFVNTSVGGTNVMLLRSIKDFVTSLPMNH